MFLADIYLSNIKDGRLPFDGQEVREVNERNKN